MTTFYIFTKILGQVYYFQFMNGHHIRYISQQGGREKVSPNIISQKNNRQTFISPHRDQKNLLSRETKLSNNPSKYIKGQLSFQKEASINRASPFQRSRIPSNQKNQKSRVEYRSGSKCMEDNRREVLKFSQIKKKLDDEIKERERLQQLSVCQELKLSNLTQQINRLRLQKRELERNILQLQKTQEEGKNTLFKAQQTIDNLNKNIKEMRINQKSLNNLKNLQNQIDFLQEKNKKITSENEQLVKLNSTLKLEIQKITRENTSESENNSKIVKTETASCRSIEKKMGPFIPKSDKQKFLEANLHQLQKKLYEKEKEMKKMQIQLNCIDRKKALSIDEVRSKKDKQIKDLRQRYMKVSKDLKQTKDKFQKNEKKQQRNIKDSAFLRKVKSSKHLGMTSESQQVTLQLSSEP